jgi:sugar fermentation stimulation protein A
LANRIAEEAIANGVVRDLRGYPDVCREVRYGGSSRIDLLLKRGAEICYVEVKNVTLVDDDGRYAFPDAVTSRGLKHLGELSEMVRQGHRAVMLYVIQRSDGDGFTAAADIDPAYADGLRRAIDTGVEALAYWAEVSPERIEIVESVAVML